MYDFGGAYSWYDDAKALPDGLPPVRVLRVKPSDHWQGLMSLPEARQEVGVYGDSSQDDLIVAKLNEAIGWVEDLRGAGRPLTRTEFTCYYPDLGSRLMLDMPAPMPMLGSYSAIVMTLSREGIGDSVVSASEYILDVSGERAALALNDYSALREGGYQKGVQNPVRVEYTATPDTSAPDWIGCRGVVKAALNMAYMARETPEGTRGFMTVLARMMPNRVPLG